MRQIVAVLILIALFVVLVGSRFQHSDGDRLAAISRLAVGKVREGLPPAAKMAGPFHVLRKQFPEQVEDRVRARLESDKRFSGVEFTVAADGGTVTLRGVVPDAKTRRQAVAVAQNTVGIETVVDELAVPE
jgi:osmotically-inducible protein OsmY